MMITFTICLLYDNLETMKFYGLYMGCSVGNDTEENVSEYQFSKLDACKDVSYMGNHYINDPLYHIYVYHKYHNKDIIEAKVVKAK